MRNRCTAAPFPSGNAKRRNNLEVHHGVNHCFDHRVGRHDVPGHEPNRSAIIIIIDAGSAERQTEATAR